MKADTSRAELTDRPSGSRDRAWLFHLVFELGVLAKGVDGAIEFIGGMLLLFLSPNAIWRVVYFLIQGELAEDPTDPVANLILRSGPKIIQTKFSASVFLLLHGAVKLGLVAGLATNRLWSYPAAIVVFMAFTGYQLYQLSQKYSAFLAIVTVLDVVVIWLIIVEYRHVSEAKTLG